MLLAHILKIQSLLSEGKYYVYSIEKGDGGKQRHYYIAPLDKIIETYITVRSMGVCPHSAAAGI
ncbi:MAG: putative integrase [Sulfolobus sp.]